MRQIVALGLTSLMVVAFQNCSKVGMSDLASSAQQKTSSVDGLGNAAVPAPTTVTEVRTTDGSQTQTTTVTGETTVGTETETHVKSGTETETHVRSGTETETETTSTAAQCTCQKSTKNHEYNRGACEDKQPESTDGQMTTISQNETAANANEVERSEPAPVCTCQQAETEPTHHGRGGDGDHGKQTVAHAETQANIDAKTDFKAVCLAAASKVTIHDPAKIQKIRGSNVASGNHIELVSDVRGKMIIVGTGVDATIDLIQNTRGALILCNVKVLKATDVRGHVVLVDSKIVDQSNIRGNLRTK